MKLYIALILISIATLLFAAVPSMVIPYPSPIGVFSRDYYTRNSGSKARFANKGSLPAATFPSIVFPNGNQFKTFDGFY